MVPITRKPGLRSRRRALAPSGRATPRYFNFEFRRPARFDPLLEEVIQTLTVNILSDGVKIVGVDRLPRILLGHGLQKLMKFVVPHDVAQHLNDGRAFARGEGPVFGRIILQPPGLDQRRIVHGQRGDEDIVTSRFQRPEPLTCSRYSSSEYRAMPFSIHR